MEQRIDRHSVTFIMHDVERFIKGGSIKEACTYTFYITDINGQTVKAKVTCRF